MSIALLDNPARPKTLKLTDEEKVTLPVLMTTGETSPNGRQVATLDGKTVYIDVRNFFIGGAVLLSIDLPNTEMRLDNPIARASNAGVILATGAILHNKEIIGYAPTFDKPGLVAINYLSMLALMKN